MVHIPKSLLIQFTFCPSLFTFPLESPVFIGIPRGEERAQLFTLSSPSLHLFEQEMLGGQVYYLPNKEKCMFVNHITFLLIGRNAY